VIGEEAEKGKRTITLSEASDSLQPAREDRLVRRRRLLLLNVLRMVRRELVEQVVDNVGPEDLNAKLERHSLGVLVDGNVETEDDGELLRLFEHGRSAHDVLLVNRSDVDTRDLRREAS
jgi:hypothetical protein